MGVVGAAGRDVRGDDGAAPSAMDENSGAGSEAARGGSTDQTFGMSSSMDVVAARASMLLHCGQLQVYTLLHENIWVEA